MITALKITLKQAAWAPLTVFAVYALVAKGFGIGAKLPWLDIPAHFVGGAVTTYFFAVAVFNFQIATGKIPAVIQLALSIGLTAVAAIVWEFLEYGSDFLFGTTINLGVSDTLSDLFFGLLGGAGTVSLRCVLKRNCGSAAMPPRSND